MSWNEEIDSLSDAHLFDVKGNIRECPFCREEFRARFTKPTKDEFFGRWQKFCSRQCMVCFNAEKREAMI